MKKLVRDRIGELEWPNSDQKRHLRPARDAWEFRALLRAKLREECDELLAALGGDGSDPVSEAADVLEVLQTLLMTDGLDLEAAERARHRKRAERGGFVRGLVYDVPDGAGE